MAWVKIPAEHHPIFVAALPNDRRISTIKMFGAVAALVHGNLFGGLFGRSFMVKLGERDHAEALGLDGAEPFDPMGTGRVMSNTVFMPEATFGEDAELKDWLRRAFDHALTLPPKVKKPTPQEKPAAKRPVKAEPAAKAKRPVKAESAAKTKAKAKRPVKAESAAKTKAKPRPKTKAKPRPKTKPTPVAKPKAKAKAK
jgi:TfoX/Sxy family transcriptional regulator of competence genes